MRRVAVVALAELANAVDGIRSRAVDAIGQLLGDRSYLVRVAAHAAAEKLGDPRLLEVLDTLADSENDGRLRRDAAEAAAHIRAGEKKPAELARLREDLDRLRTAFEALREQVDRRPE